MTKIGGRSRCDIERRVGREILSSCCFAEKGRYGIDRDVGLRRSRGHYRTRTTNEACEVNPLLNMYAPTTSQGSPHILPSRFLCTPPIFLSPLSSFRSPLQTLHPLFLSYTSLTHNQTPSSGDDRLVHCRESCGEVRAGRSGCLG